MKLKLFSPLAILLAILSLAACQEAEPLEEAAATVAAAAETVAAYEPVFEPMEYWWTLPGGLPVECGYLVVPENRENPDGSTIRVATAILRHPGGNSEPDPIVYVHGGPVGGFMNVLDRPRR